MPTRGFVTIRDFGDPGELTTSLFWLQDITAVNFASVTQDLDEIKDAIATVVLGEIVETGFTKVYPESFDSVAEPLAQRENKWLVTYRDMTQFLDALNAIPNPGYGKLFTMEIGTAALTGNMSGVGDNAGSAAIIAFKAAFTANIRSPYNHSATTPVIKVESMTYVGRNT